MKKLLTVLGLVLIAIVSVVLYNTFTFSSKQIKANPDEIVQAPYDTAAVKRLAHALRFKTISYDEPEKIDYAPFDSLHEFLRQSFPLIHQRLEREVVNQHSLLYRWKGLKSDARPVILYAHLDVVPVEEWSSDAWVAPPFAGLVKDDYIWGRGALDDKGSVMGILEAVERLLSQGFTPQRDVFLVFGHDEEIGGNHGARRISELLASRNIKAALHLDEGGFISHGMVPGVRDDVALIGTAEKGFLTLQLTVKLKGGHSSRPPKQTATGELIKALAKLEQHTFGRSICVAVQDFIDYTGPEMSLPLKAIFANSWLFKPLIMNEYQKSVEGNATVRTTGVTTVIHAGVKENVVPGEATAKVNFRILPGETTAEVIKKVNDLIADKNVEVKIFGTPFEPSSTAPADAEGFRALQRTVAKVFPNIKVAPFLMLGSTDSKHFQPIAEHIYRFIPVRMDAEELSRIHGVNERISVRAYMECIAFYETFLREINSAAN